MSPAPASGRRISLFPQLLVGAIAAVGLYIGFTLPPRAAALPSPSPSSSVVLGAYHIHSDRSDGTGTPAEIARAAAAAGLQFVILTDHGDATRPLDPPTYRQGVLVIDAAEISSAGGHVVALGLERVSPYPLAGETRDVIDDIHRLGGWAVAAHPDSPKPELRWRGQGGPNAARALYDGIEWLNLDSEWRDETPSRLIGTFARYVVRGAESIVSIVERPVPSLRRWDTATRTRRVVGLAALDAHARLPWRTSRADQQERTLARLPSYRQMFRTVSQAVVLDRPPTGDGAADGRAVLEGLRNGRTYSVMTALGAPGQLSMSLQAGELGVVDAFGLERAAPAPGTAVTFNASVNDPAARIVLFRNGAEVARGVEKLSPVRATAPGAYRIEAYRPGSSVPWIVSNPVYLTDDQPPADSGMRPPPPAVRFVALPGEPGWAIERSPTSSGTVTAEADAPRFSYALGPGVAFDQFAALVATIGPTLAEEGFDRVRFNIRAERPTRLSVQLRMPGNRRWRHSVYADETPRDVELFLQDFQPADGPTQTRPVVARVTHVLFVVDTLNAFPGTTGTLWLSNAALGVGNVNR